MWGCWLQIRVRSIVISRDFDIQVDLLAKKYQRLNLKDYSNLFEHSLMRYLLFIWACTRIKLGITVFIAYYDSHFKLDIILSQSYNIWLWKLSLYKNGFYAFIVNISFCHLQHEHQYTPHIKFHKIFGKGRNIETQQKLFDLEFEAHVVIQYFLIDRSREPLKIG